jgi:thioredoxin reductase
VLTGLFSLLLAYLQVYIIHRRDEFRASKIMRQRVLEHPKIKVGLGRAGSSSSSCLCMCMCMQ